MQYFNSASLRAIANSNIDCLSPSVCIRTVEKSTPDPLRVSPME